MTSNMLYAMNAGILDEFNSNNVIIISKFKAYIPSVVVAIRNDLIQRKIIEISFNQK